MPVLSMFLGPGRFDKHPGRSTGPRPEGSGGFGIGEPRREGGGVQVEHHVAESVGPERREALVQEGLLRGGKRAAQPPLEQVLQRLEGAFLDAPLDGLVGRLGDQLQPAAKHLVDDAAPGDARVLPVRGQAPDIKAVNLILV